MAGKIEPGCLCVITIGIDAGREVTAVHRVTEGEAVRGKWRESLNGWLVENKDEIGNYEERHLLRIDDYDTRTDEMEYADSTTA